MINAAVLVWLLPMPTNTWTTSDQGKIMFSSPGKSHSPRPSCSRSSGRNARKVEQHSHREPPQQTIAWTPENSPAEDHSFIGVFFVEDHSLCREVPVLASPMFYLPTSLDTSSNKCIASSNKCLTSSNKKLVETISYQKRWTPLCPGRRLRRRGTTAAILFDEAAWGEGEGIRALPGQSLHRKR